MGTVICPNCAAFLHGDNGEACISCGWKVEIWEGIPVFLSSKDQANPLLKIYSDNYHTISRDDIVQSIQPERYLEHQAKKFVSYIPNLRDLAICEIGTGKGHVIKCLLEKGATRIHAVDIALPYLRELKRDSRVTPLIANVENLPFQNAFDLVVCTDVLEHILNVGSFLFCVNRALKLGGTVYIRVPYLESLVCYSPHVGCKYQLVHLRNFNKDLLRSIMKSGGFAVERFEFDGYWADKPQPWWTVTKLTRWLHQRILDSLMRGIKDPLDVALWPNQWARLLMRPLEVTVVARKNWSFV